MSTYIRYPSNVSVAPNVSFMADIANSSQSIPNASPTKIQFANVIYNNGGYYDGVTNFRFTPLVAGYYNFFIVANWAAPGAAATTFIYLYKNGSQNCQTGISVATSGVATHSLPRFLQMNGSTDYVEAFANVTGNGSNPLQLNGASTGLTYFIGQLMYQT